MFDRPDNVFYSGSQRAEALRSDADRVRLLRELRGESRVPAWRVRTAAVLRGFADRLAPSYGAGGGMSLRGSEPLSAGGPPPC